MEKHLSNEEGREIKVYGGSRSFHVGDLPEGCLKCIEGAKIVLYTTGYCTVGCKYCTISDDRSKRNDVFVNERAIDIKLDLLEQIAEESDSCIAEGAGITGGDPMEEPERTIYLIKQIRQHYGSDYHLHLYTSGVHILKDESLVDQLFSAGLNELRFHPKELTAKPIWELAART
ncbi:MAG: radical SAM protein, partial [Candidatus Heimdallarchaeota archaeon]|nr:radical SAM protein [Candidatus Heimdallarchaeota archaeon]